MERTPLDTHPTKSIESIKILKLSHSFTIDIAAYAVMSNHYHIVCRVDKANAISDLEVVRRWHQMYKGTLLSKKYLNEERLDQVESDVLKFRIRIWRERLYDISWFMRCLNDWSLRWPTMKMVVQAVFGSVRSATSISRIQFFCSRQKLSTYILYATCLSQKLDKAFNY